MKKIIIVIQHEKIMKKLILISLFIFFNSACSPRYKIIHDYIPPENESGLACLQQQCHKDNLHCHSQCQKKYNQCLHTQDKAARENFYLVLDDYYSSLELYQSDLELFYEKEKSFHSKKQLLEYKKDQFYKKCKLNKEFCSKHKKYKKKLKKLYRPYKPQKPHKPGLQEEISIAQQSCHSDCQCQDKYNQCYISCGGIVNTRKICLENCEHINSTKP